MPWLARPFVTPAAGVRSPDHAGVQTWLSTLEIVYLKCLSEETLKAAGPFYLVAMPWEVKYPTSLHWKCVTCRGLHNTTL